MEGLLVAVAIIFFIVKNVVKIKQGQESQNPQQSQKPEIDFEETRKRYAYEKPDEKNFNESPKVTVKYESAEGSESDEGKCIEPDPQHCAVEHPEETIYSTEIGTEPVFSKDDFVKGIIMSEILSKPKSLR